MPASITDSPLVELLPTENHVAAYAIALGAPTIPGFGSSERKILTSKLPDVSRTILSKLRKLIIKGHDPLGEILTDLRSPAERRPLGATYTPARIVSAMLDWAQQYGVPSRVVDPGTGSAIGSTRRMDAHA